MEMAAWVTVCLMMWAAGHQSADANQREDKTVPDCNVQPSSGDNTAVIVVAVVAVAAVVLLLVAGFYIRWLKKKVQLQSQREANEEAQGMLASRKETLITLQTEKSAVEAQLETLKQDIHALTEETKDLAKDREESKRLKENLEKAKKEQEELKEERKVLLDRLLSETYTTGSQQREVDKLKAERDAQV